MNLLYFVAAVIWTVTVTATLESDSHGNWSNEKKLSDRIYDQEVLSQKHEETRNVEEESTSQYERIFDASETDKPEKEKEENEEEEKKEEETLIESLGRNEQNQQVAESQQQFSKQLVQPYVLPLKAKSASGNASSESADTPRSTRISQVTTNETVTVEYIPSQEIILQDYSSYNSQESSANDLRQTVSKENLADVENVGEFGQRVRSSPQLKSRNNDTHRRLRNKQSLDTQSSSTEDQRKQYRKNFRPYVRKLNASSSDTFPNDRFPFSPAKNAALQRSMKQKETDKEGIIDVKDASSSTSVPLGKFSGPIVVPDLPRQKKYSYATTVDYINENNEVSRPAVVESVTSKVSENLGYLAAPPVVLNPLQVGVALMNAGQDLVNGQVTLTKLYPQEEPESQEATEIDSPSLIQSDAPGNSSSQSDQVGPVKSVEIQKSVEIFHTAPIQEIHYPVEFVPNVQQLPLVKQRGQEDQRKPGRGQLKEQRQNQVNVYRSNEILDESVSLNSQERSRYEYNANENDVVYSATSGQVDQAKPPTAVFGAKEQVDGSSQYDQVTIKHSKLQGVSEINVKQGSYEATAAVAQPPRGVESVPGLASPENLQITQQAPQQILLTKVTGELPAELRLLMYHHPAEKNVHAPQTVDVVEKKVPYAVEKVIEKQITIPQPFPVHIPIDRVVEKQIRIPYPVHVEKVIEKKVPLAVQRFIIPLPIHFRLPQPVPIAMKKVVEKPVPIPVPMVEKIVEKPVHLTRPYSIEIEKNRPYTLESTKLVKSVPIYNVQPDVVSYQQPVRQNFQTPVESTYASDGEQGYYNSTSQFYGPGYLNLNRPHARQPTLVHALPKKFATSYSVQYPHSVIYSVGNGNLLAYGRVSEKDKLKDEYVGPVPRKTSIGIQSKSLYSSPDAVQATLRRTRQEAAVGNTGSFRQSKMEYGFKPPMVPSVQYDEQTATKVE